MAKPQPDSTPAAKTSTPAKDSIVAVSKRNKDLEKRSSSATSSLIMVCVALTVSVLGNIYQGVSKPEPRYFAQDAVNNTLTPVVGLTQPITSRQAIQQHAVDCIGSLHNVDFLNYRDQLNRASWCFTKTGWERYMAELESSGTLELITRKKVVLTGAANEPPVIVGEGTLFNALYWDIQVPYRVRYVGQGSDQTIDYVAKIKVIRVPTTENPKGIAIAQFVASRSAGGK